MPSATVADSQPFVRAVFLDWEKLRVVYNAVLVVLVLACLLTAPRDWDPDYPAAWRGAEPGRLNWPLALLQCSVWGVVSNLCFFLGPAVEAYAAWLGWRSPLLRYGLFLLGTLFTAVMAAAVVAHQLGVGVGFD